MEVALPAEIWNEIFSHLSLRDLSRARSVCRSWWELTNRDQLWKPLALRQMITENHVRIDTNEDDPLETCRWSRVCFSYARVAANWEMFNYKVKECPLTTECVLIRLPYLISTFYCHRFVDVQRLVNGDFVPWAKLQLPEDGQDGPFVPQMTSCSLLVVSRNAYSLIFRLLRGGKSCFFQRAVCLSKSGDIEHCSVVQDLSPFLKTKPNLSALFTCCSASNETIWLYEDIAKFIYVWNFVKCELTLRIAATTMSQTLSNDRFFFCVEPEEITVYALSGARLSVYTQQQAHITGVCEDDFGCCFIQTLTSTRKAMYLNAYTGKITEFQVDLPLKVSIRKSDQRAYCLTYTDGIASIVCVSLESGLRLWETVVSSERPANTRSVNSLDGIVRFIRDKYIAILGVDVNAPEFIAPLTLSLITLDKSPLVWSRPFTTARIVHLSDHFIVTRERIPRGGMRYKYEIYNFLRSCEEPR